MDEAKGGLERFVHEMCEVILYLLRTLYICKLKRDVGEEVDIIVFDLVVLLQLLDLETHVPAHSPHLIMPLHVTVHLEQRLSIRF